jgi:hypothetical protein
VAFYQGLFPIICEIQGHIAEFSIPNQSLSGTLIVDKSAQFGHLE